MQVLFYSAGYIDKHGLTLQKIHYHDNSNDNAKDLIKMFHQCFGEGADDEDNRNNSAAVPNDRSVGRNFEEIVRSVLAQHEIYRSAK